MDKLEVGGKRKQGGPKIRWKHKVEEDLTEKGWNWEDALESKA